MPATTFAAALRQAREAAGFSQAALARRAGLTGSYISVLEARRKPAPSPRVIAALCRVLAIDPAPLLDLAALERAPARIRRRLARADREGIAVRRTGRRILTSALFQLARQAQSLDPLEESALPGRQRTLFGNLLGRVGRAKDLREAEAEAEPLLEGAGAEELEALAQVVPAALARSAPGEPGGARVRSLPLRAGLEPEAPVLDRVALDARYGSDGAFLWRVPDDDAHPRVESGDLVLVEPGRAPQEGGLVALVHEGRGRLRVFRGAGAELRLEAVRPEIPPLRFSLEAFRPAGPVVLVLRGLA